MRTLTFFLLTVWLCATPLSVMSEPPAWVWDTYPAAGGGPLFIGVSPRYRVRDKEMEVCLKKAAVQAAQYKAVKGSVKCVRQKNSRGVGYLQTMKVEYDEDLAAALVDELEIVEKHQDNRGTYLLARLKTVFMGKIDFKPHTGNSMPDWINKIPTIENYLVSVGIALRKRNVAASIDAGDQQALEELVKQIGVTILSSSKVRSAEGAGTAYQQTSAEIAEAVVEGFYVLARWRSANGRYYYSLAICPEAQEK